MFNDKEENKDDRLVEDVTLTLDGYNIYFKEGDVHVEDRFVRSNVTYADLYEFVEENELTLPNEENKNDSKKDEKNSGVVEFILETISFIFEIIF